MAGSAIVYLLVGLEYNLKVWQEAWPKLMRATLDACMKHKAKLVFFDNVYMYDIQAIPIMKEMPEMMYQYDRDYFFDSGKFSQRFDFKTTTYQEGVNLQVTLTKGST